MTNNWSTLNDQYLVHWSLEFCWSLKLGHFDSSTHPFTPSSSPRRPHTPSPHDRQTRLTLHEARLVSQRVVEDFALAVELGPDHRHVEAAVGDVRAVGDGEFRR